MTMKSTSDPFALFPDAFRAVMRNPRALALYIVLIMGAAFGKLAVMHLSGGEAVDNPELTVRFLALLTDLALVAIYAFAQTVAFSWLGQDLDRPLWRVQGLKDALARFYSIWLILDLLIIALSSIAARQLHADSTNALGHVMMLLFVSLQVISIPIGAAIMFHGELKWRELGQSLAPLGRQFFATTLVVFFSGCSLVLLLFFLVPRPGGPFWLRPLVEIPGGLAECIIFTATWRICILDRDADTDDGYYEF